MKQKIDEIDPWCSEFVRLSTKVRQILKLRATFYIRLWGKLTWLCQFGFKFKPVFC